MVLFEQFAIDPRLVIEAFEKGPAGQLDQVLKAGAVLGKERQVVARFLDWCRPLCRSGFSAQHRLRNPGSD